MIRERLVGSWSCLGGRVSESGELCGCQRRAIQLRSMPTSQNRDMGHPAVCYATTDVGRSAVI